MKEKWNQCQWRQANVNNEERKISEENTIWNGVMWKYQYGSVINNQSNQSVKMAAALSYNENV